MSSRICSYCGHRGHNKRTCPERPDYIKNHERDVARQKRESYAASIGLPSLAPDRRCSVCGEKGHNAKTCNVKRQQKAKIREEFIAVRKHFLNKAKEIGFGTGCVVEANSPLYHNNLTALVLGILWDDITPDAFIGAGFHRRVADPYVVRVQSFSRSRLTTINLPFEITLFKEEEKLETSSSTKVVSRINSDEMDQMERKGWVYPSDKEVEGYWKKHYKR